METETRIQDYTSLSIIPNHPWEPKFMHRELTEDQNQSDRQPFCLSTILEAEEAGTRPKDFVTSTLLFRGRLSGSEDGTTAAVSRFETD